MAWWGRNAGRDARQARARDAATRGESRDDNTVAGPRTGPLGPAGRLFVVFLLVAATVVLDYGVQPPPFRAGDKAETDVVARVSFSYYDPAVIEQRKKAAAAAAPRVYREVENWPRRTAAKLKQLCALVEKAAAERPRPATAEVRARAAAAGFERNLAESLYRLLLRPGSSVSLKTAVLDYLDRILNEVARRGVLGPERMREEQDKTGKRRIVVLHKRPDGSFERRILPLERSLPDGTRPVLGLAEARREIESGLPSDTYGVAGLREQISRQLLLSNSLVPNLVLDLGATRAEKNKAVAAVPTDEPVRIAEGTLILRRGQVIRRPQLRKLWAEAAALKKIRGGTWRRLLLRRFGYAAFVAALLAFFLTAISRLRPDLFSRRRPLFVVGLLSLGVLIAGKATVLNGVSIQMMPLAYAGIVASLSLGRFAALLTIVSLCLPAVLLGAGAPGAAAMLLGAWIASLPARKLVGRWDLIRYGALGGVVQGALLLLPALYLPADAVPVAARLHLTDALWGFLSPLVCSVLALGTLPLVEWACAVVTNIRLVELCDPYRPALRRLMMEAPGTWAHSLQVAHLAEPAAEAVAANTRLLRAGCYYHDLGKVLKPEYFVENRMDAKEHYGRLAPSVGALIVAAHVKDGIALAKEYGLPKPLVDFIPQHHGTTMISFFYHTARRLAEEAARQTAGADEAAKESAAAETNGTGTPPGAGSSEENVGPASFSSAVSSPALAGTVPDRDDETKPAGTVKLPSAENGEEGSESRRFKNAKEKKEKKSVEEAVEAAVDASFFRYPGPKPQTRETAILMLADTVEAATRTMEHPSQPRLKTFVHKLIMEKLADGQFDECPLTFKDLTAIESSFLRTLTARFHSRLRYPAQGDESEEALFEDPVEPRRAAEGGRRKKTPERTDAGTPPPSPAAGR